MNKIFFLHGARGFFDELLIIFLFLPLLIIIISAWRRGIKKKNYLSKKSKNNIKK
jgi:cbb3-type cytochrome oxidase subunit 3|tara:strand:- start:1310 stop:1474 length:165 start_codon:yes stop_codon:yes gene_type:complete